MFIRIAHSIPEKHRIEPLRQYGEDQAPDPVINKILIDLRSGSKAPSELCSKRHKCNAHSQRHFAFINQQRIFLTHLSFLCKLKFLFPLQYGISLPASFIEFYNLSRIQDQLVVKSQFDILIKLDHSGAYKFFQEFQASVADTMFSGKLSAQFF